MLDFRFAKLFREESFGSATPEQTVNHPQFSRATRNHRKIPQAHRLAVVTRMAADV
jgi:hypothetical protein